MEQQSISVEYIDHMGSDMRVCNMARQSFGKWKDESLELDEKDLGLLEYLSTGVAKEDRGDYEKMYKASTHWAPFAHCILSIRVRVPVFIARQLVKHQVGLVWSEESRRYISDEVGYWLPEVIHAVPEGSIKQGSGGVHPKDETLRAFMWISTETAIQNYYHLLREKVAPEEARMVLPLNHMVNFSWTGSLLALLRVLKQRQDGHAQLAAQEFARKLKPILEEHFPNAANAFTKYM